MDSKDLFALALGLTKPWYVTRNELDTVKRQLEIGIDFERGGTFPCPECGQAGCKAYDTEERRWRHLNFFQFETVLSARVPRIDCGSCGKRPVQVPWARPGSGFTLLFEALLLTMVPHMPVAAAARLLGEHDTRLWRVIHHYVDQAMSMRDDTAVRRVGVDETSSRRGHNYISVFVDLDVPRVLFAAEGRDASTVARFAEDLTRHTEAIRPASKKCAWTCRRPSSKGPGSRCRTPRSPSTSSTSPRSSERPSIRPAAKNGPGTRN